MANSTAWPATTESLIVVQTRRSLVPTVPQERLPPLTSTNPWKHFVSIASKKRIIHCPAQALKTSPSHPIPIQWTPTVNAKGVGLGHDQLVRDSRVQRSPPAEKMLHARGTFPPYIQYNTVQGCVHAAKCFHRGRVQNFSYQFFFWHTIGKKPTVINP